MVEKITEKQSAAAVHASYYFWMVSSCEAELLLNHIVHALDT